MEQKEKKVNVSITLSEKTLEIAKYNAKLDKRSFSNFIEILILKQDASDKRE